MLNPLTRTGGTNGSSGSAAVASWPKGQDIAGWELKLIMEYCSEVRRGCGVLLASMLCAWWRPVMVIVVLERTTGGSVCHTFSALHMPMLSCMFPVISGGTFCKCPVVCQKAFPCSG
jgi:hypothetical protein